MQIKSLSFFTLLGCLSWCFGHVTQLEASFSSTVILLLVAIIFGLSVVEFDTPSPSPQPIVAAIAPVKSSKEKKTILELQLEEDQKEISAWKTNYANSAAAHELLKKEYNKLQTTYFVCQERKEIVEMRSALAWKESELEEMKERIEGYKLDHEADAQTIRSLLPGSLAMAAITINPTPNPSLLPSSLPSSLPAVAVVPQPSNMTQTIATLRSDLAAEHLKFQNVDAELQIVKGEKATLEKDRIDLRQRLALAQQNSIKPPNDVLLLNARAKNLDAIENTFTLFLRDEGEIGPHESVNAAHILQILPTLLTNSRNNSTQLSNLEQQANLGYQELCPEESASGPRVATSQYLREITEKVKSLVQTNQRLNEALSAATTAITAPAPVALPQAPVQPVVFEAAQPQTSIAGPSQPTTTPAPAPVLPSDEDTKTLHFLGKHFTMRHRLIHGIRNISRDITDLSIPLPTLSKGTDELSSLFKDKHGYAFLVCLSEIRQLGGMFAQLKTFVEQRGVVEKVAPAVVREWNVLARDYEVFNITDENEFTGNASDAPVTVDPAAAGRQVKPMRKGKGRANPGNLRP